MLESAIYEGTLRHRRHQSSDHQFTYPLFMALLDIDHIPELMAASAITSYNRANLLSFQQRDHFGDPALPLRERLDRDARANGVELPDGKIFLLTHLRNFGYTFNPVSFFYCFGADEKPACILAEVNNTFGETHNYWLTAAQQVKAGASQRYRFNKQFHVSPFFSLGHLYDWTFNNSADRLIVESKNLENGELAFDSTLSLQRREWTARNLHRTVLRFPFMTARTILGIHWQALRLWAKKVPVVHHPGGEHATRRNRQDLGASWKTH
jgi:DUF1365 family protein